MRSALRARYLRRMSRYAQAARGFLPFPQFNGVGQSPYRVRVCEALKEWFFQHSRQLPYVCLQNSLFQLFYVKCSASSAKSNPSENSSIPCHALFVGVMTGCTTICHLLECASPVTAGCKALRTMYLRFGSQMRERSGWRLRAAMRLRG